MFYLKNGSIFMTAFAKELLVSASATAVFGLFIFLLIYAREYLHGPEP